MTRFARLALMFSGILCAAVLAPPALAVAPVAEDVSAATADGQPVTVTLHGSDDFDAMLSFSIVGGPQSGSLGEIGPPNCSFPGGQADCTADVTYTPRGCVNGADRFVYRVDDGIASDDATATVAVSSLVPAAPGDQFVSVGSVFTATASDLLPAATVDYGDGGGPEALAVAPDGSAELSHVYSGEGSFAVTVRNPTGCEAKAHLHAFLPGATQTGALTVDPGSSGTLELGGLTATLTTSSLDPSAVTLLAALYPPGTPGFDPGRLTPLAAFDLRTLGATRADVLVAKFRYPEDTPPGDRPALLFFDPRSGDFRPVRGSTLIPDSLLFDPDAREITVAFDDTSFPRLQDLTGTQLVVAHDRSPRVRIRGVLSRCAFGIRVADDGGLRRVRAKLDGAVIETSDRKRLRLRLPVSDLGQGRHRLRVVAIGRGGARGADAMRFHRFGGRCFRG